jgi:hypothetical protein
MIKPSLGLIDEGYSFFGGSWVTELALGLRPTVF